MFKVWKGRGPKSGTVVGTTGGRGSTDREWTQDRDHPHPYDPGPTRVPGPTDPGRTACRVPGRGRGPASHRVRGPGARSSTGTMTRR